MIDRPIDTVLILLLVAHFCKESAQKKNQLPIYYDAQVNHTFPLHYEKTRTDIQSIKASNLIYTIKIVTD